MKYLVTHGNRDNGPNPMHKPEGIAQIKNLDVPANFERVILGTGTRFIEVYEALGGEGKFTSATCFYSPFCGSADGLKPPGIVEMATGKDCDLAHYIGINTTPRFDAWGFVSDQPEGTLFIAGGEFLLALGLEKTAKGALYALDDLGKTATLIQQG